MNVTDLFGDAEPYAIRVEDIRGTGQTIPVFKPCTQGAEDILLSALSRNYGLDPHHEIWPLTKGALA